MEWIKVDSVVEFVFSPAIVTKISGKYAGTYYIDHEYIKFHIPEGKRYAHEGYYIVRVDQLNAKNKSKH